MITKDEALKLRHGDEIHLGQCQVHVGERGGIQITQVRVRVSGQVKVWKTKPDAFQFPIKYGMYQSGHIHDRNASEFHLASECALVKDPWLRLITRPILGNAFDDADLLSELMSYVFDSRNELQLRAAAARRADYVVGAHHPPRVPNDMLVRQFIKSAIIESFGNDVKDFLSQYPNLDPREVE